MEVAFFQIYNIFRDLKSQTANFIDLSRVYNSLDLLINFTVMYKDRIQLNTQLNDNIRTIIYHYVIPFGYLSKIYFKGMNTPKESAI